jgi:hypothetical protein
MGKTSADGQRGDLPPVTPKKTPIAKAKAKLAPKKKAAAKKE